MQGGMTWRLKKKTGVAGHKRKSDVDLNTFAPEFGERMPHLFRSFFARR